MAASMRADRTYHQDYIARIRYSNTLPPPPNPPKLLHIPGTGLAGGDFKSAKYGSRLARDQVLNIEADAELGLPIDLVGIPGVFTGDESYIQGLQISPAPHPNDRALLRPPNTLGKPNTSAAGVSFLRRTEYISSDAGKASLKSSSRDPLRMKLESRKRKRDEQLEDSDPSRMLNAIHVSFALANANLNGNGSLRPDMQPSARDRSAWETPVHPTNPELKVIDEYPLLPDPSAITDAGSYILIKFQTSPVAITDVYDKRLDVGILRPLQIDPEAEAQYETQLTAHENDSSQPKPTKPSYEFEFFLPPNASSVENIKMKANIHNLARNDEDLYDSSTDGTSRRFFSFGRVRAYETYQQMEDQEDPFGDTLAIALHHPSASHAYDYGLQRAAYFYPVSQRSYIRARRNEKIAKTSLARGLASQESDKVDLLEVVIRDEDENEQAARTENRSQHFENTVTLTA